MSTSVPIRALCVRALNSACKASQLSTMEKGAQDLVVSSLHDLKMLIQAIDASGMFSPNETLDDIPTSHLPYLLVEYVAAEMEGRMRTLDRAERMQRLGHSQRHMHIFLDRLRQYEVVPDEERKLFSQKTPGYKDMAKRREFKINQFKQEKVLRSKIETIRTRRGQSATSTSSSDDLNLIASLLPPSDTSNEKQQTDDEDDEDLRDISLLAIRLIWAHAQSQVESMEQELELLRNAPPVEPELAQTRDEKDPTWRLDSSIARGGPDGKGPLLDSSGKPLRPFTILPGASSQRSRSQLQADVFRPDHRLPTMTMDEYLEEEQRRGNIITGGGPQSQNALTRSEQLTLDSEMDGTAESELKAEEKRQEDESWARYTDVHPKGEGNTMNRG